MTVKKAFFRQASLVGLLLLGGSASAETEDPWSPKHWVTVKNPTDKSWFILPHSTGVETNSPLRIYPLEKPQMQPVLAAGDSTGCPSGLADGRFETAEHLAWKVIGQRSRQPWVAFGRDSEFELKAGEEVALSLPADENKRMAVMLCVADGKGRGSVQSDPFGYEVERKGSAATASTVETNTPRPYWHKMVHPGVVGRPGGPRRMLLHIKTTWNQVTIW